MGTCELIGGGSPRHLNTKIYIYFLILLLSTTHISTHAM